MVSALTCYLKHMEVEKEAIVQQRWYEIARREAGSEKDSERIATSFVYEGFRLPLLAAA